MVSTPFITLTLVIFACFSTTPANAGAARRHTIERFILGTGVALMGTAIIHSMTKGHQPSLDYPRHKRHDNNRNQRQHARYDRDPRGHWEIQKVWVASPPRRKRTGYRLKYCAPRGGVLTQATQ